VTGAAMVLWRKTITVSCAARRVTTKDGKGSFMAEDGKTSKRTSPNEFFNQVKAEARKIVWPSREETVRTSIFVFIMMLILSFFFLGVDTVFGATVRWLLSLA
jgi:preprotein translocase subunit SecE